MAFGQFLSTTLFSLFFLSWNAPPDALHSSGLSLPRQFLPATGPVAPPDPAPAPAPAPIVPETCDGKPMGVYPDLTDPTCRKFYRCQPIGPIGKTIKIDMTCPPGTVFDPVRYCVPPWLLPHGARCSTNENRNEE